jgi:exodeoxyribonuclease VIII
MVGISKTGLDNINRSPAHYHALHLDPRRPPPKKRAGQLEGTLAHCAILEPHLFGQRYVVVPSNAPRRPTAAQWAAAKSNSDSVQAKNWWRDFDTLNQGKTIITGKQYDVAMRQADSVRQLHDVDDALKRGQAEVSAMWIDPETGAVCRCRPDWVARYGPRKVVLLDVKTYADASAWEFRKQIARKRYHVQDAFYSDGYQAASGDEVMGFVFVAVESEYPYAASALMLDDRSRAQGRVDYRRNLDTYAECKRTGIWPSYGQEVQLIDLPSWAMDKPAQEVEVDVEDVFDDETFDQQRDTGQD